MGENDKGAVLSPGPVPEKAEATDKKSSFTQVLSIRTVLGSLYMLTFYYEKFST